MSRLIRNFAEQRTLKARAREKRYALIFRAAQQGLKPDQISIRVGFTAAHVRKVLAQAKAAESDGTKSGGAK
jgi:hypothetical protein